MGYRVDLSRAAEAMNQSQLHQLAELVDHVHAHLVATLRRIENGDPSLPDLDLMRNVVGDVLMAEGVLELDASLTMTELENLIDSLAPSHFGLD